MLEMQRDSWYLLIICGGHEIKQESSRKRYMLSFFFKKIHLFTKPETMLLGILPNSIERLYEDGLRNLKK